MGHGLLDSDGIDNEELFLKCVGATPTLFARFVTELKAWTRLTTSVASDNANVRKRIICSSVCEDAQLPV